ncbi:MAG: family transcriptional regulator [Ramlibacter sp.]|nr:family transcriptional regulator [Ramlibacter sp.]
MSNIASILKSEIARVARKEVRAETEGIKKASTQYRSHIATLKREVAALERHVRQLLKGAKREAPQPSGSHAGKIRFSAKRLADHRAKLGLSAKDYGALIGVSPLSIYKWEGGDVRPRASQLQAIAAVRKFGKREAATRLEDLQG